jgi:hypothetical protein
MSDQTTTAYIRAVEAAAGSYSTPDGVADAVLDAALDVEEIARAIHASDQGPGVWDIEGERFKDLYRQNARAVRAALLGGAA